MPTTSIYALPYPALPEVPNVPLDMQELCDRLEVLLSAMLGGGQPNPNGMAVPVGSVSAFAGASAPVGWLLCDGQAVSRTGATAALFAIIGTTYGAGNGSTTFNVPDLRGRSVLGAGTGTGLTARNRGAVGGAQDAAVVSHGHGAHQHTGGTGNDSPDHAHASSITDGAGTHNHGVHVQDRSVTSGGLLAYNYHATNTATDTSYNGGHNHSINNPGATARHAHAFTSDAATPANAGVAATDLNMQPYLVLNHIIKT